MAQPRPCAESCQGNILDHEVISGGLSTALGRESAKVGVRLDSRLGCSASLHDLF